MLGKREGFGKEMLRKYEAPFWDMHRADLQLAMFERAQELGVRFRFGARVTKFDFDGSKLSLLDGEKVSGDLIVAADGESSPRRMRQSVEFLVGLLMSYRPMVDSPPPILA